MNKSEIFDFIADDLRSETGIVAQNGTETDLGVEYLAGGKRFVLLYEIKDIVRKSVVASPWDIGKVFIYDYRNDVGFLFGNGGRVDCEGSFSLNPGKVFNRRKVEIRVSINSSTPFGGLS